MIEDKNCPKCNELTESGAIFCGNCGFRLIPERTQEFLGQLSTQQVTDIPLYAKPKSHHKKHWAALALVFGILGIGSATLLPIMGIVFGIVGIVLITSSFSLSKGWVKPSGLIVSILAIFVGLGFTIIPAIQKPKIHGAGQPGTSNGAASLSISTPCYSIKFSSLLNIDNSRGSCSLNAYNGANFGSSSNIYKIVASTVNNVNQANLASLSKTAIAKDIATNLPEFNITSENSDMFDGNPAYGVHAYDSSSDVAMIEESVLNTNAKNNNFFVIIHAINGETTNLNNLKTEWQWND